MFMGSSWHHTTSACTAATSIVSDYSAPASPATGPAVHKHKATIRMAAYLGIALHLSGYVREGERSDLLHSHDGHVLQSTLSTLCLQIKVHVPSAEDDAPHTLLLDQS